MELKMLVFVALVALILRLGWLIHRRSLQREPVHGGGIAAFFNLLSGMCFVAILPTVCASVLFLHPETVEVSGFTVHPLVVIVVGLSLASLLSSFLFALVEKAPAERTRREMTQAQSLGWTEQDAKSSGL